MCKEHWFRLPGHMRKAVWETYAEAGGTDGPIEDLQYEPYWRACANAVEFICKMEGKPLDNGYRNMATKLLQDRMSVEAEDRIKLRKLKAVNPAALVPGARVKHTVFGLGRVIGSSGSTIRVQFDEHGEKELSIAFKCKLSLVEKEVTNQPEVRKRLVLRPRYGGDKGV